MTDRTDNNQKRSQPEGGGHAPSTSDTFAKLGRIFGQRGLVFKVFKQLAPGSAGAEMPCDRHDDALVCERQRITAGEESRCTTVELLVEQPLIRRRERPVIVVLIAFAEKELQALERAAGATWYPSPTVKYAALHCRGARSDGPVSRTGEIR